MNRYSGLIFSIFTFGVLPITMSWFTIDPDLVPKFLITSVFIIFYSASVLLSKQNELSVEGDAYRVFILIASILLWMLLSMTNSINKGDALFEFLRMAILYSFFIVSFITFQRTTNVLQTISRWSVIAVYLFSIVAAYQVISHSVIHPNKLVYIFPAYLTSTLANKNFFSEVLVLILPLLIIGVVTETKRWRKLFITALVIDFGFVIILQSLAAIVAIIFASIFYVILSKKHALKPGTPPTSKRIYYRIAIFALPILIIFYFLFKDGQSLEKVKQKFVLITEYVSKPELLSKTRNENSNSVFERLVIWRNSFRMISDYPIMGAGLNNWKLLNSSYGIGGSPYLNSGYQNYEHPHNDYLFIWAEQGPIGILLYVALLVSIFRTGIKKIKSSGNDSKRILILLMSGIIAFMVLSFFAYPRSRFYSMILLMMYFAFILNFNLVSKVKAVRIKPVLAVTFIVAILSLVAGYYRIVGEYHTKKLMINQLNQDYSRMVRESEKAYSWYFPLDLTTTPMSWYKGMAYFNSGLVPNAIAEYEKALMINPNHLRLLNDLATAYEHDHQTGKAIAFYKKALGINPFFVEANLNISAAYFNVENTDSSFYFIDRIYQVADTTAQSTYSKYLEAILHAKAVKIVEESSDTINSIEMLSIIENKNSLRHIYELSKVENQPFAKYFLKYFHQQKKM